MPKTIYEELIEAVKDGKRFYVDFQARDLCIGRKKVVKNGEWGEDKSLHPFDELDTDTILLIAEAMYEDYRYSVPSERSERKRRTYFKALPLDDLTDEQIVFGERRETAQARLEGFLFCMILSGWLMWNEDSMGKWFYKENDFVLLRNWIEKE